MTALAIAKQEPTARDPAREGADQPAVLSFPPFRIDLAEERLWKDERELHLRRKTFAILRYLAQNPRRLVTHSEVVEAVWGGKLAMSESLLRTQVYGLRKVIGAALIETVAGRGYRFVADMVDIERGSSGTRRDATRRTTTPPGVRETGLGETRKLEVIRHLALAPTNRIDDTTVTPSSARHAHLLKQLADILDALGTTATVVVMVGEAEL